LPPTDASPPKLLTCCSLVLGWNAGPASLRAALDLSPETVNRLSPFALWHIKQILFLFYLPFYAKKIEVKLISLGSCYYRYVNTQSSIAHFNGYSAALH